MADSNSAKPSADDLKKLVMDVFEEATKDCEDEYMKALLGTVANYDSLNYLAFKLFDGLGELGMADKARELFTPVSNLGILSPVAIYTMVIILYSGRHDAKGALKVYHRMISTGITPVTYTYTILITTLAPNFSDKGYLGYAKKYFLEMLDKGMKPTPTPYINLMDAIAYRETEEEAKAFAEQIKAKGFIPPPHGFRYKEGHFTEAFQALKMYANLIYNDTIDKGVKMFFTMVRNHTGTHTALGNKMFNGMIEAGNVDEAMEFYNRIQETGAEPLVLIHTSVINTYLDFCNTKGALEAYRAMVAAGVAPNAYTYTVLINGLSADPNFFEDAKKYLLEMMDKGKQPNAATFTAVIEGFAKQENKAAEEEGKQFVQVMVDKEFVPNVKAMMKVLKGRPKAIIRSAVSIVLSALRQ